MTDEPARPTAATGEAPEIPRRPVSRFWAAVVVGPLLLSGLALVAGGLLPDPDAPTVLVVDDGVVTGARTVDGEPADQLVTQVLAAGSQLAPGPDLAMPSDVHDAVVETVDGVAAGRQPPRLSDAVVVSAEQWLDAVRASVDLDDPYAEFARTTAGARLDIVRCSQEPTCLEDRSDYQRIDVVIDDLVGLRDEVGTSTAAPRLGPPHTIPDYDDSGAVEDLVQALEAAGQQVPADYEQALRLARAGEDPVRNPPLRIDRDTLPDGVPSRLASSVVAATDQFLLDTQACVAFDPSRCEDVEVWRHEVWRRTNLLRDALPSTAT